jgi:hypothetical protein
MPKSVKVYNACNNFVSSKNMEPVVCGMLHAASVISMFLMACMPLSDTLHAAQSEGMQLGAQHMPLGACATLLIFFYETGILLCS